MGEELRFVARRTGAVIAYLQSNCIEQDGMHACRFFQSNWESLVGDAASCGTHFCTAVLAGEVLEEGRKAERRGVFVDVGAFHPIHLSNTFFFERCLGWRGLCAEPNPNWVPYFNAYRPNCQLVRNCVFSRPRNVTMSFEKDPIEAYIQEEDSSGAVLIEGDGKLKPQFTATCRTLEDISTSAGLEKPAVVDYLSVDAEAAEVEIFRDFPFDRFNISVVNVEVQAHNYYDLDVIFTAANYVKLAVLGGDHVYAKLGRPLRMPDNAAEWHKTLSKDFYAHVQPQTATMG